MKKINLLFILVFSITIISCSNDNDDIATINAPSNSIKKVSETTYIAGSVSNLSADFNYENGVLKSISDANHKIEISYNGTKISNTIIYTNNLVSNTYSFNYNGTLLETILNTSNNFERTFYNYTNGVMSSEMNQSLINSNWETFYSNNFIFFNGNIIEKNNFFQGDPPYKTTYEHDTKLNPMHYMNPSVREIISLESCNFKNLNNEIKSYRYSTSTSTTPILDFTYQIIYNTQNLPISIKKYTTNNTLVSEATFEYN